MPGTNDPLGNTCPQEEVRPATCSESASWCRYARRILRHARVRGLSLTGSRQVQFRTPGNPLDIACDYTFMDGSALRTSFGYEAATRTVRETMGTRLYKTVVDGAGRPTQFSVGSLTPSQFSYDSAGRLTQILRGSRRVTIAYDERHRPSIVTDPLSHEIRFEYDGFLPTAERWRGAVEGVVERTFGTDLLVRSERVNGAHEVTYSFYDANGLPGTVGELSLTRHLDTAEVTQARLRGTVESRSYDSLGELARLGAPGYSAFYTRDPLGRITRLWEFAGEAERIWDYAYDEVGRLQTVQRNGTLVVAYTYDPSGNRLRAEGEAGVMTATYDDQDRLLTSGDATYTYTPNGELATKTTAVGVTRYTYDTLGNLTRVALPDGRVITYLIDGRNRRVARLVDHVRVRGWLYADQLRPIAELDGSGVLVARFVYASRPNVPDYFIKGGTTYRLSVDHLGSPRAVVDVDTGEVVQRLDFGPFGEVGQDTHPGSSRSGLRAEAHQPGVRVVEFL